MNPPDWPSTNIMKFCGFGKGAPVRITKIFKKVVISR